MHSTSKVLAALWKLYDFSSVSRTVVTACVDFNFHFVDDVVIAEYGDSDGIQRIENRVTSISSEDADMKVNQ